MLIVEFKPEEKVKIKKHFRLRGTIKRCADSINHDRTTVARIVKNGTGDEVIVKKIVDFVNDNTAA